MSPEQKAAARDQIAALRMRSLRLSERFDEALKAGDEPGRELRTGYYASRHEYVAALESLVDELTAPEPEEPMRPDPNECVVCHCQLQPPDSPPHCQDCSLTDEHLYAWESQSR